MNLYYRLVSLINFSPEATPGAADTTEAAAGGIPWTTIIMILAVVALFYFMMIRPERKKKKERTNMMNTLEIGAEVTTIGGFVGKVVHIEDNTITFETGEDRVRVEVSKWAISSIGKPTAEQPK